MWTRAIETYAGHAPDLTLSLDGRSVWVVNSRGATRLSSEDRVPEIGVDFATRFTPGGAGFVAALRDGGVVFGLTETVEGTVIDDCVVGGIRAVGNTISGSARDTDGVLHFTRNARFGLPMSEKALARCASAGSNTYLVRSKAEKNEARYGTYLPDVARPFTVRVGALVFQEGAAFARFRPKEVPARTACLTGSAINFASALPRRVPPELNAVAPGEFVHVDGSGIGPGMAATVVMDETRSAASRAIRGVRVLFNGIAAALIGAGQDRLTAQVPFAVGVVDSS